MPILVEEHFFFSIDARVRDWHLASVYTFVTRGLFVKHGHSELERHMQDVLDTSDRPEKMLDLIRDVDSRCAMLLLPVIQLDLYGEREQIVMLQDGIARLDGVCVQHDVKLSDSGENQIKLMLGQRASALTRLARVVIVERPRVEVAQVRGQMLRDARVVVLQVAGEQEHRHDTVGRVPRAGHQQMVGKPVFEQRGDVRVQVDVLDEHAARVRSPRHARSYAGHGESGRPVATVQWPLRPLRPRYRHREDERTGSLGRLVVDDGALRTALA